ncbi:MAG: hypothetical protein GF363_03520 [Chitinivibrionales bacterium]|nr:hypothetical protein [Chitinivibrionales bacterium]
MILGEGSEHEPIEGPTQPERHTKFVHGNHLSIWEITPFRDGRSAFRIQFGAMGVVAFSWEPALSVSSVASAFKERFDIAVCSGCRTQIAHQLNERFRPGMFIYAHGGSKSTDTTTLHPNLRKLASGAPPITLRKDSRERIIEVKSGN